MKQLIVTILCAGMSCQTACATTPPSSCMTVHLLDAETGEPIEGVVCDAQFRYDKNVALTKKFFQSDTNGICRIEGPIDYIGTSCGLEKEGYYWQTAQLDFKGRNRVLNRWEPWNPTIEVKMRKKKNPVPMVARGVDREMIPEWDKSIGFDLERGDWVAPYGKGRVSDMIFFVQKTSGISGATCEISFSNKGDGIQEFVPDQSSGSEFIFPYLAPTNNYSESMCREKVYTDEYGLKFRTNAKPDAEINHLFRVRTILDDKGNVQQACYGRIKGELRVSSNGKLYFKYWFNPVPNERSLEYSGKNLLKK